VAWLLPSRLVPRLRQRPRVRHLIERTAQRALREVGSPFQVALPPPPPPPPPEPPQPEPADFIRALAPHQPAAEGGPVTHALFARLDGTDVAEVERRLAQALELQAYYTSAPTPAMREALTLIYGVWLEVPAVIDKTGLGAAQPPEDVHAMARGPLAAAGGLYEADLVVDALASAGIDLATVRSALDFGCSSGRVVRALAAAHPDIHWHGCDPNAPAIAWASEHLPGVELFVSENQPPLPLADASLDLVYAISIWSHFAPELGLLWLEEMRRLLHPGGHLVLTTHGLTAVAYYALLDLRTPQQSKEIADALYSQGWWYAPEFGEEGDWGVVNPDWGTAFLSPEWLLTQLCPRWRVLEFAPGRNQDNQDVYVLQRV
jgi:SAM-dependent methyltransferase